MKQTKKGEPNKTLSDLSRKQCKEIMKKIESISISFAFKEPVNPELDHAPDYFKIIKKPMDLSTVDKKLEEGSYPSVDKWKEDMNLIWSNAMKYNPPETPLHSIAQELSNKFKQLSDHFPNNEGQVWAKNIKRMTDKINKFIETRPDA